MSSGVGAARLAAAPPGPPGSTRASSSLQHREQECRARLVAGLAERAGQAGAHQTRRDRDRGWTGRARSPRGPCGPGPAARPRAPRARGCHQRTTRSRRAAVGRERGERPAAPRAQTSLPASAAWPRPPAAPRALAEERRARARRCTTTVSSRSRSRRQQLDRVRGSLSAPEPARGVGARQGSVDAAAARSTGLQRRGSRAASPSRWRPTSRSAARAADEQHGLRARGRP